MDDRAAIMIRRQRPTYSGISSFACLEPIYCAGRWQRDGSRSIRLSLSQDFTGYGYEVWRGNEKLY